MSNQTSIRVAAILCAFASFSILLIFINKTLLSKLRHFRTSLSAAASGAINDSSVHFSERNNAALLIDYDVFQLTFLQCAFTALAVHLVLRFAPPGGSIRPRFGLCEFVTSNLFVVMLLMSNLCVKLIPVSALPVSRSLTFLFVLGLDRAAAKLYAQPGVTAPPRSLFTPRRCVVYALILFGYVGVVEVRSKPVQDGSMLIGILCGMAGSLIAAVTNLAMKFTMRKRTEEASRDGAAGVTSGLGPSLMLCYAMNVYATVLGITAFLVYQLTAAANGGLLTQAAQLASVSWTDLLPSLQSAWLYTISSAHQLLPLTTNLSEWPLFSLCCASGLISVLVSALNLAQIEVCSPLTVQVANATKSVTMTLLAVAYYGEQHATVWYAANMSMLAGTLLYATESRSVPTDAAKLDAPAPAPSTEQCASETVEDAADVTEVESECQGPDVVELMKEEVPLEPVDEPISKAKAHSVNYTCLVSEARPAKLPMTRANHRSRPRAASQHAHSGSQRLIATDTKKRH